MHQAAATPAEPTQPDPQQDRPGRAVPENIAALLHVVQALIAYGRYFAETLPARGANPLFPIVAAVFGTHKLARILAHLRRGLRRAIALERYLLARAEKGLEIPVIVPSIYQDPDEALAPAEPLGQSRAKRPPARPSGTPEIRVADNTDPDDPYTFYIPTMKELAAEVRHRPIGRTILAICLDLGVVPAFCASAFVTPLFDAQLWHGANFKVSDEVKARRQESFLKERQKHPDTWDCDWREYRRDILRELLGCLVGEDPPPLDGPLQYLDWPPPLDGSPSPSDGPPPQLDVSPPPLVVSPPPLRDIPPPPLSAPRLDVSPPLRRLPGNHIAR